MKKIFFALAALAMSVSVYCQTEAMPGKDCSLYVADNTGGSAETSFAARTPLKIENNGVNGLVIRMYKRPDMVSLNLGRLSKDVICVNKDAEATVHFADGKTLLLKHMGKLNCEGDFRFYMSESFGTMNEKKLLGTKKIKKIVIGYSKVTEGKIAVIPQEIILTSAEADTFLQILNCFEKL